MRRFRLCNGSGLGAPDREEADGHMLREQDPCQSSNELQDDGEGAFGSGLRIREVLALHLGEQDHHLHRSCGPKYLLCKKEVKPH